MIIHIFFHFTLLFDEMEDVESELGHPSLEHLILSPPIFGVIIKSTVVSENPVVLVLLLFKFPSDLDGHEASHLILDSCHKRKGSGLVGARGVLAHSVGIIVGKSN